MKTRNGCERDVPGGVAQFPSFDKLGHIRRPQESRISAQSGYSMVPGTSLVDVVQLIRTIGRNRVPCKKNNTLLANILMQSSLRRLEAWAGSDSGDGVRCIAHGAGHTSTLQHTIQLHTISTLLSK